MSEKYDYNVGAVLAEVGAHFDRVVNRLIVAAEKLEGLGRLVSKTAETSPVTEYGATNGTTTKVAKALKKAETVFDDLGLDDDETETEHTLDDVITAFRALPVATRNKTVQKVLAKLNAKRVQDLKPVQYAKALSMVGV